MAELRIEATIALNNPDNAFPEQLHHFFYGFPLVPLITVGQAETDLSGGILQELDVHVSCRRIFIYQIHFFRGDPVNSP